MAKDAESKLWAWADAAERQALERIFIQLVRPGEQLDAGEHGSDTRRVAARTEFSEGDWALIHRLASTRLVVVTRRPTGRDTAELAHQALVEKWPQLQRWVEENREFRADGRKSCAVPCRRGRSRAARRHWPLAGNRSRRRGGGSTHAPAKYPSRKPSSSPPVLRSSSSHPSAPLALRGLRAHRPRLVAVSLATRNARDSSDAVSSGPGRGRS
ncbi:hypothetical protein LV779_36290 [Streptomyces thinghirensis]|nr:hypothetical protein [Streptomyces thinghirensis]